MPLVRLVFPFMGGIALFLIMGFAIPWPVFLLLLTALIACWFVWQRYFLAHYSRRWVFGTFACLLFVIVGYQRAAMHRQICRPDHFSHYGADSTFLRVRIIEPVVEKANSFQVIGRVTHLITHDALSPGLPMAVAAGSTVHAMSAGAQMISVQGRLMIYLAVDSLAANLNYGDVLVLENHFECIRDPTNPAQFSYRRFLANKNIYHSTYRRAGQWTATGENQGKPVVKAALTLRYGALSLLEQQGISGREFAVVSALLLGYREYLDEDLQREFAGAGAMHILCVSGLHVGIIYMLIHLMLSFLQRTLPGRITKTLLSLLLIWAYAAVTGFSPSVLRASAMFSFVAVGQCLNRQTNIYNTLAASALLLTIIDPYIITRIGFQLSYLAVVSIVALQPRLYRCITCKNWLVDKAWSIATVSLAAQLATGPLALYYFNQFPNYFLLTNLLVIPMASLVLYAGLLTIAVSWVPLAGYICSRVLHWLLMVLHTSVRWVEQLPGSTSEGIFISLPETLMVFLTVIMGCQYLIKGHRSALLAVLAMLCLISLSVGWRHLNRSSQQHFIVYSINNAMAIDFFTGRKLITLHCEAIGENPRAEIFSAEGWRVVHGSPHSDLRFCLSDSLSCAEPAFQSWLKSGNLIQFGEERIKIVHRGNSRLANELRSTTDPLMAADNHVITASHIPDRSELSAALQVDYLIVTQNARQRPEAWLETFSPAIVIVDASNSHRTTQLWIEACEHAGIDIWPVREMGAFNSSERKSIRN